jgi:hypothetical protein
VDRRQMSGHSRAGTTAMMVADGKEILEIDERAGTRHSHTWQLA